MKQNDTASPPAPERARREVDETKGVTLRQGGVFGGWVVSIAAWVLAGVLFVGTVLDARSWGDVARAGAFCALIAWAGWLVGAFPRLVVRAHEVNVVNLLRSTRVPRELIEHVDDAGMVTLHVRRDGAPYTVTSWGAPSAPKPRYVSAREQRINERTRRTPGVATAARTGVVRTILGGDSAGEQLSSSGKGAEIRWNARHLLLLGFLLVINVAIWLR